MAAEVPMPKLGLTMEEGLIIEWLVPDGATVEADVPIMRIETDKTETEVGSPGAGRLHQIGQPGEVFACGQRVGLLLAEGEQAPAAPAPSPASGSSAAGPIGGSGGSGGSGGAPAAGSAPAAAGARQPAATPARSGLATPVAVGEHGRLLASPNAKRVAAEHGIPIAAVRGSGPGGRIVSEDVEAALGAGVSFAAAGWPGATRGAADLVPMGVAVVASTAARQLADQLGVYLAAVPADPTEARVTRDDVVRYVRTQLQRLAPGASAPATVAPAAPTVGVATSAPIIGVSASMPLLQEPVSTTRLSGMRGTIAKRMHASLQEMAQLTLTMDADMGAVLDDRATRKLDGRLPVPSITDYVVAATARALVRHPAINAQITLDGIAVLPEVHVGLAVAVDNGLLVPVVRDTAHRDLTDLAAETARVAAAAREGKLAPTDLEGGTFSVSALGAFGVDVFTPVINPPNAGILGIGRLRDDVVVTGGVVGTVKRLTLSLTWDHRVVDGVPAAQFCRTVVELLAAPADLD